MARSGLLLVLLVSGLVMVQSFDESPELDLDEDLLHKSSTSETEDWGTSNTDWDATNTDQDMTNTDQDTTNTDRDTTNTDQDTTNTDRDTTNTDWDTTNTDRDTTNTDQDTTNTDQDMTNTDRSQDWDSSNSGRNTDRRLKEHRNKVSDPVDNSSLCGDFLSEATPDGLCRIRATLPAGSASSPRERCPDLFRCRAEASDWPRESGNRKQQLERVQEAVSEMKDEIQDHQRRVTHLETQSAGEVSVNSSVIGRVRWLEERHAEVFTLLHVHSSLLHQIQDQLQTLTSALQSTCTLRAPPLAIRRHARPPVPLVSSCPSDCAALIQNGVRRSGLYSIVLTPGVSLPVYCDMDTDGGGWTVFQRRRDGSVSFNRGWDEYSGGFGDVSHEHWLGNSPLHLLVTQRHCSLRIQLMDWSHVLHHASYHSFSIEGEQDRFRLHVSGFTGSVPDSFGWYHDGQHFSTPDSGSLCAEVCHSGWWFNQCYQSNLNGVYYQGGHYSLRAQNLLSPDGLVWFSWTDSDFYSLKASTMMLRPQGFRPRLSP